MARLLAAQVLHYFHLQQKSAIALYTHSSISSFLPFKPPLLKAQRSRSINRVFLLPLNPRVWSYIFKMLIYSSFTRKSCHFPHFPRVIFYGIIDQMPRYIGFVLHRKCSGNPPPVPIDSPCVFLTIIFLLRFQFPSSFFVCWVSCSKIGRDVETTVAHEIYV